MEDGVVITVLVSVSLDTPPSEDSIIGDEDDFFTNPIFMFSSWGVVSVLGNVAVSHNAFCIVLGSPGNRDGLLFIKQIISSAARRKWVSNETCGIGICFGIMVAVSIILSRCVFGI